MGDVDALASTLQAIAFAVFLSDQFFNAASPASAEVLYASTTESLSKPATSIGGA